MKYTLFVSILALAGVNGRATSKLHHSESGSETVERLRRTPNGWNDVGAPSQDRKLHFRIALRSVSPL